ncbi:non-ribosomal peptide synthetase [Chlorogloea sp. CCALA 695]|uniref:non-ribosomal peptide synthetase n=1 Tax=Chlorogloea sp. CCALA 695 TaxID=2107693 RepID=UPI000D06E8BD|nr:non-ribosomal peptide synthetase [Chlorogloea sp. CCALA 695]PSB30551.1 non-ribosomal peptide synthetase [Chlorogloea sp. CCALA 695]
MLTDLRGFRLSPQQKQLWLWQQESNDYVAQIVIEIIGNLNSKALQATIQKITLNHEILRTAFRQIAGMKTPIMVVEDNCFISWQELDLGSSSIEMICHQERNKNFNFEQVPLFSVSLVKVLASKHILLITLPALCADSETLNNLFIEICDRYASNSPTLKQEIIQYAQFCEWQNQLLTENHQDYWQQQDLSTLPLILPFQADKQAEFKINSYKLALDNYLVAGIKNWLQRKDLDLSNFLLACWQTLLYRITNQSEIIVGRVFNGREYEELQATLGLIAKSLPIFTRFTPNLQFEEVVRQVTATSQNACEYQEYFTKEVNNLLVLFELIELPEKRCLNDVTFAIDNQFVCIEKFNIKISVFLRGESIDIRIDYNQNLFEAQAIALLAAQFQTLITSAISNPSGSISQLNILPPQQLQQILVDFNQTQVDYPQNQCIHQLIETQAKLTPNAIAVIYENEQLTYSELNSRADRLACHLQQLGVKPETVVGIYLERSNLMLVAMLGILKAGGAYLPIEATSQCDRISYILEDAQVAVLLTQEKLANLPNCIQLCLDDWERSSDCLPVSITPNNLAYIIYTSGSTGKPKGVAIEHRQLCNYTNGVLEQIDLPHGASFATVSTFAADLGNTVIFAALVTGGCLHIISQERATNPVALADYFRRHAIDCLKIVPSHLNALLTSSEDMLPSKLLILGGETANWELVDKVQQLKPDCQILNHYGPTETTVGVLTYKVANSQSQTVPIGRPLANTQAYILDDHLQPVPIFVPGELYIGGANLARGYLNSPELTAQKFINNPFSDTGKLYKTGDKARFHPDGSIEFLGRSDRQVKIHGFRIELAEVEAIFRQHPAIKQAVVTVCEERLIAYIVAHPAPTVNELRHFGLELLPEYMLPSAFVFLDAIPLTPNGKIDFKSLPVPDTRELATTYTAPRTSQEQQLANIWAEVLKLPQVGIDSNFFELGGDSILSIQVVAKANQAGLQLTPKHLFEHQTIAQLAAIAITANVTSETGLVTGLVPLTPIQHWFFAQNLPQPQHWNQAVLLEVTQPLDIQRLEGVIGQLLQHHDALRLRFHPRQDGWQQICTEPNDIVPVTRLDLSSLLAEEQEQVILNTATELQASLDLSTSLMQVAYFDLGTEKLGKLLIIIHHLVIDGVSWRVFLEDLQTAYQQLSSGETIQLPAKTTAYKQWAEQLIEYAQTIEVRSQFDYWQQVERSSFKLPVDFANNLETNTVASAQITSVTLNQTETQALLQQVPSAYHTQVNDILLTALTLTFAQWTGEKSLLLTLESHGREDIFPQINLSRTVGWFTSHFPVQLSLDNDSTPGSTLKSIKEQLRNIPQHGISYGILKYLSAEQLLGISQVKFNYLGQFDQLFADTSLFKIASQSVGATRSPHGRRSHLIEIDGMVANEQLQFNWTYSQSIHRAATIESLAEKFIDKLRSLIVHCQSPEVGGYTPSDFPEAQLNQTELDNLLGKIGKL